MRGSLLPPAFALRAPARHPSLASPLISALARRAVAREASEGWWRTQSKSNPSPPSNSLLTGKLTEFHGICLLSAILKADTGANSEACSEIPYATEQGIISEEQGFWTAPQGVNR